MGTSLLPKWKNNTVGETVYFLIYIYFFTDLNSNVVAFTTFDYIFRKKNIIKHFGNFFKWKNGYDL